MRVAPAGRVGPAWEVGAMPMRMWSRRGWLAVLLITVLAGCGSVVRDQTTGEFVDDSVITTKVKARLAQEPGVSALAVSVDTLNGVVILSGFVENESQREKAIAAARGVGGVRHVKGEALVVKPERSAN